MSKQIRMQLEGVIKLSKTLVGAEATIKQIVENANSELFTKGVPAGKLENAPKIEGWRLEGKTLNVKMTSGTYVRAHSALARFNKVLGKELGRTFKTGLRGVELRGFTIELPQTQISDAAIWRIRSLDYVADAKFLEGTLTILLKTMGELELKRNTPDRVLTLVQKLVEETAAETGVEIHPTVIQGAALRHIFKEDPAKVGLELGWFKEFPGRGQWTYTTPYAKLLSAIEEIIVKEVLEELGFQPFMLPKLIPLEVMRRMPGYLEDIPEGMYYVCPPPRDPQAFAKFKEKLKVTGQIPKQMLKEVLKEPEYVLAPAQCEPFWQFFSHETLRVEDLPFKLYDRAGWTYRWEGGGVEGLVRVQEFRRIELGFIGTPEQVVEIRDTVRDNAVRVVGELLNLEWRVVAATPFYMRGGKVGDVQESRNVSAFDIEVYTPYRGPREKAEWLEITACFIHKDKFVKSFSIHEAKNRPIWTGCTGFGVSRWVAAFLATHGFNPEDWPQPVKKLFGSYKLPRTLLWPKKQS